MKSQPEIKIRRLAVFGGYGDLDASTTWSRRDSRQASATERRGVSVRRLPENAVITLEALPQRAQLPVAA